MDTISPDDIFQIRQSDIANLIGETSRFVMHVLMMHILSVIILKKEDLFGTPLFQTIIMTIMAIVLYHLFFRKIIEPELEKMKNAYAIEINIDTEQNKDNHKNGKETNQSISKPPKPTTRAKPSKPTTRPKPSKPTTRPKPSKPTTRPKSAIRSK